MKWLRTIIVFDKGNVVAEQDWAAVHESYVRSIKAIDHPAGTGKFTLRRAVRWPNDDWVRNGVGYMRSSFLNRLIGGEKWQREVGIEFPTARIQPTLKLYPERTDYREPVTSKFGNFDFQILTTNGLRVA